jgi:phage terminase small subunit
MNATEAYIQAGYNKAGARANAARLIANDNIQARIAELKESRLKRVELTQDEVLIELKNFAYSDITETLTLSVEQIKELPPEVRRLITQYKKVTRKLLGDGSEGTMIDETIELKFVDKMKAFEMLNRHIGFYEEDNKQGKSEISINFTD